MAEKFPVGLALNETFQFVLHRWTTILRFGLVPLLLAIVVTMALAYGLLDISGLQALENDNDAFARIGDYLHLPVALTVLVALAGVMALAFILAGFMASVYRLVALGEDTPGWYNVRIDGPALRVFFANIILNAITTGIVLVGMLIASMVTGISVWGALGAFADLFRLVAEAEASGTEPDPAVVLAVLAPIRTMALGYLFALVPMIYVNIRLSPFLAGSAAENRLLLAGSLALTKGNFWSLFGFHALLLLSLMALTIVFQLVVGIFDVLSELPSGGAFALVAAIAGAISFLISFAFQLFTMGIQLAGNAIVYRRLKTGA